VVAEEIPCPRCRAPNPKSAGFCATCGASLDASAAASAQPDPLIGTTVSGQFLVKQKLGEGGMGAVYEAEQTSIGRKVALKVLHPHLTDETRYARFRNEAAAASRLGHPNTITVFDFGRTDSGSLFIAMELIEGPSLDDEIRRQGAIDWRRATGIAAQICRSLQHAHQNGIVHRDLKPENVMLTGGGEEDIVKVLDFGIAKVAEEDGTDQRQALTKTGMVFGTPRYMSPEQVRGDRVDARSDIYSTGVLIYQMLTGTTPFVSRTQMGLLTKHLVDPPRPFAEANPEVQVPAALEGLVMQMLAKELEARPQSMREVAERLEALPVSSRPTLPMPPLTEKKGKGKKIAWIVLGLLLVLGAGATAVWYFVAGPGRPTLPPPVTPPVTPPGAPPYTPPQLPATPPSPGTDHDQPPRVDPAPMPAIPIDTGGEPGGADDPGGEPGGKDDPGGKAPKPKKKIEEEIPIIDEKTEAEIVEGVKDGWGKLKDKLGELKSGDKDSDTGK
jgi:serine/threonine protein kinase